MVTSNDALNDAFSYGQAKGGGLSEPWQKTHQYYKKSMDVMDRQGEGS